MNRWAMALVLLTTSPVNFASTSTSLPLWPSQLLGTANVSGTEKDVAIVDKQVAGKPWHALTNVTRPKLTVYLPTARNTRAAVLVFPGGGFQVLAMDLEGTEVCGWLVAQGVSCVVANYRVPSLPYEQKCNCYADLYAVPTPALEDAQRAIGLIRTHASEWRIDPHKVGVLGFSAGGYVVAQLSGRFKRRVYKPVDAADQESARPDFSMAIYPGHLATNDGKLNPNLPVVSDGPPTFLVQAEDDHTDGVNQSLVYYAALEKAGVPAEMHLYATGGHAFGLRTSALPITQWPETAELWLKTIHMIP